jgi:hypothetical protein
MLPHCLRQRSPFIQVLFTGPFSAGWLVLSRIRSASYLHDDRFARCLRGRRDPLLCHGSSLHCRIVRASRDYDGHGKEGERNSHPHDLHTLCRVATRCSVQGLCVACHCSFGRTSHGVQGRGERGGTALVLPLCTHLRGTIKPHCLLGIVQAGLGLDVVKDTDA